MHGEQCSPRKEKLKIGSVRLLTKNCTRTHLDQQVSELWEVRDVRYRELLDRLIELAFQRHHEINETVPNVADETGADPDRHALLANHPYREIPSGVSYAGLQSKSDEDFRRV
jgi:hypothetical protein